MKKENGYFIDENNNKWNDTLFNEEQAIKFSKSLINCKDCQDCQDCQNCRYCLDCQDCKDCQDCQNCRYCQNCQNCRDCQNCQNCRDCRDYKQNPGRYTGRFIGSRKSQTIVYWNDEKTTVVCGCFINSLDNFEKKVIEKYDDKSIYGIEYRKFIKIVRNIIKEEKG